MEEKTLGRMIADLRIENNMTQLELGEKLGVTDKAVSEWERDLTCPDAATLPRIADLFNVSTDELLQVKGRTESSEDRESEKEKKTDLTELVLKAVALAMGVAVAVLSIMKQIDFSSAFGMIGIGLACLAIVAIRKNKE